ncbi:MAG: hypothetical protein IIT72_00140 [Lachnospiraceae bacterium]|nr:hypothetical protein [Lachnospiraceae bacterium]MBQ2575838.1 hypothetical protein [Lachnospiraceae bacterium]MBQ5483885.1 hypothetical protein [Lachnospiraceae bacterium]MCR4731602.1 hypothetical protein [Lachnospiraceae bacterium]MEE3355137.1 hypothetical protein [Candidatus Weimeria sp.]
MKEVMEEYGEGILAVICLAGMLGICGAVFISSTGPLGELFVRYTRYLL